MTTKKTAKTTAKKAKPGAPSTQDLYTGMSGQFVAMSEFLWRGYNVAIPAVDVGEDIFVVEAEKGDLRRVQVKTAGTGKVQNGEKTVTFKLSRSQLNLPPGASALFFMLFVRWDDVDPRRPWRFILIRSSVLNSLRLSRPRGGRGRPLAGDGDAGDQLAMKMKLSATDATAWGGQSFATYLDTWSETEWPIAGPMKSRAKSATPTPTAPLAVTPPAAARPRARI